MLLPDANASELQDFASFQREAASAETAVEHLRFVYDVDVSDDLAQLRSRTLVLHRRDDRAIPFDLGRELAATIPDARLVALEGGQHLPWRGDGLAVAAAVAEFLGDEAGSGRGADASGEGGARPGRHWRRSGRGIRHGRVSARGRDAPRRPRAGGRRHPRRAARAVGAQLEVLRLVAEGLGDAEIAERLVLSAHTVHRHMANIRTKLRQPSRAAAWLSRLGSA